MDISRCTYAILALLLVIPGCNFVTTSTPGAHVVATEFDYLLPDGKKWSHKIVLPRDSDPGTVLTLELRRFRTTETVGTPEYFPRADAEETVALAAFKIVNPRNPGFVSLQLLDIRDYSEDSTTKNPVKLRGGLHAGGLGTVRYPPSFIRGEPGSIIPSGNSEWNNGEIRLLRFWTTTNESIFIYDVCVSLSPDFVTDKRSEPSDSP